ncbi:rhodanese-like domain-containing protein [Natronospirillum operosum]|uniref:Rhodanese-like domain-containing protein n=1 Tax=Natronospirillum operosum TaxID=2759953 RepID=A0A4Z0WC22_9GAMM|nr:rhodanese-like domain-containing protein [Natronospirillum operosum]TGG92359.1 rhodanese-like domain-containing protein [Natronospirillum operosum]
MLEFIDFVSQNWILATLWVGFLAWVILSETSRGGQALTPQQATNLINTQDAIVVDVRKPEDYSKGHLPHAISIPAAKLKDRIGELDKYKGKPVIVVCQVGHSAGASGAELRKAGFDPVYRLKGGVMEWQSSRMPLVKS